MNVKSAMFVILVGLACGGVPKAAVAGWACDGGFGTCYTRYYAGPYYAVQSDYAQQRRPYFAEFPPVYYSHPVHRPYGLSPYAWPPIYHGPVTRQKRRASPVTIQNPYASDSARVSASRGRTAGAPLRIANPYFAQDDAPPVAKVASVAQ